MNATCSTCAFQLLTCGTWYDVMTSCGCYKLLTSCRSTVVPCQSCHWNLQKGAQLLWGRRANRMSRVWPCSQRCQDVPRCAKANVIKRQMNSNEMFHIVSWCFKFRKMVILCTGFAKSCVDSLDVIEDVWRMFGGIFTMFHENSYPLRRSSQSRHQRKRRRFWSSACVSSINLTSESIWKHLKASGTLC